MKLIDLHPHWVKDDGTGLQMLWFDCPIHLDAKTAEGDSTDWVAIRVSKKPAHELAVPSGYNGGKVYVWQMEGDSYENLTITPSIDMKGHWHGWVRNGEIVMA